jgi:hypothetical protein
VDLFRNADLIEKTSSEKGEVFLVEYGLGELNLPIDSY